MPSLWAAICAAAVTGPPRLLLDGVSHVPPWGAQESGLLVVAGPATGQLNTRFAWRPGQRMFCAVGDPWSKQPVAPSAESGVDQGADSGAAVGSLAWRPVGKTRLVRSLDVILRR